VIPELLPHSGSLPVGRYSSNLEDFERRFVRHPEFSSSETRSRIWNDFLSALTLLKSALPVASVWVAGSFTTSKIDPSDIDCLFVVDISEIQKVTNDEPKAKVVQEFANAGSLKSVGLLVDNYFIAWHPVMVPAAQSEDERNYYRIRGYWDDWWQRSRQPDQMSISNAFPRRGYLEVIVDGFTEQ